MFYRYNQDNNRKAFTLIELLIVVAIISILASILFPVFARARENARRASCLSNLKQMGLGLRMYTQDFDERMPPAYVKVTDSNWKYPNGSTESTRAWYLLIYPYVKNYQVYTCPSAGSALHYNGGYQPQAFSYSYNYARPSPGGCGGVYNCGVNMGLPEVAGASLAAIEDTSGTLFVVDGSTAYTQFYHSRMPTEADVMANGVKYADYYVRSVRSRHLGTIATLFVDGHAKAMPWKTILGGVNASTVKYWTTAADPTVN